MTARAELERLAGDADAGFYDDSGRWWPSNAEWCDRCQGMGTEDCDCGGDFCVCGAYDSLPCRRCDGEGYWIPTPADLEARRRNAEWWAALHKKPDEEARARAASLPSDPERTGE